MTLNAILNDLEEFLRYETEVGTTHMAIDPASLAALAAPPPATAARADDLLAAVMPPEAPTPPPIMYKLAQAESPAAPGEPEKELAAVAAEVARCRLCPLCEQRTRTVPGQGSPRPEIVFVGEGPGADEDRAGLAFVGRAGQLLTRMIEAMGLTREEVFICNVVKCRPPENRAPEPAEMQACLPYLRRQLAALRPKIIVTLGATALSGLVDWPKDRGISKVRGTWQVFQGVDLLPTFHPAYLLRNPGMKKYVWDDLQTVLKSLGRPIPKVQSRAS